MLAEGEASLWLAFAGDRAIGGVLTREQRSSDGQLRGFVENLIVGRDARGRGLGRRLMETVAAQFRERRLFGMQTGGDPSNPVSIPLYHRLGFRVVRRYTPVRNGVQEPRILMRKDF